MKLVFYISYALLIVSCVTSKQSTDNIKKMTVDVQVIIDNMPTTDTISKNYSILTLKTDGDTFTENWKLKEFVLRNEEKETIQKIDSNQLESVFKGKGSTEQKTNVRGLPRSIPGTVYVSGTFINERNSEFRFDSKAIHPMIAE